ncbi:MAG: hypothetical protein IKQ35_05100 [Bacilli bacterium]|nr:hypothetical protein [Bacilli bacterium]
MLFEDIIKELNDIDINNKEKIKILINYINIDDNNFNNWVENIFSDKINQFDMEKLPYLIDELYKTTDKYYFMLCCMLIESTCDKLPFLTNLENYPIFAAKFEMLIHTLVDVYDRVDNGIANCMALIIVNKDPEFTKFDDELKSILINATKRKLTGILNYLKEGNINPNVYYDLEIIVDLACYLKNKEISSIINEIDKVRNNNDADIYIMKYKIINNIDISKDKLELFKNNQEKLFLVYGIFEKLGANEKYMADITQEQLAKSNMIRWLAYPTELSSIPDKIELLGEFTFNDYKCFAYSFSKDNFKISGNLLGISGGFPVDKVTTKTSGYTFSKFEVVSDDWEKQATELAQFICDAWLDRNSS